MPDTLTRMDRSDTDPADCGVFLWAMVRPCATASSRPGGYHTPPKVSEWVAVMTSDECRELAKAKGVTVATVRRWVREHGEDAARQRVRIDASQAGRMGRKVSGDTWGWDSRPPRPRVQSRDAPFDW